MDILFDLYDLGGMNEQNQVGVISERPNPSQPEAVCLFMGSSTKGLNANCDVAAAANEARGRVTLCWRHSTQQ